MKSYDFLVNTSISIKQIVTINRAHKLYLKINKILAVMHNIVNIISIKNLEKEGLENIKYHLILKL